MKRVRILLHRGSRCRTQPLDVSLRRGQSCLGVGGPEVGRPRAATDSASPTDSNQLEQLQRDYRSFACSAGSWLKHWSGEHQTPVRFSQGLRARGAHERKCSAFRHGAMRVVRGIRQFGPKALHGPCGHLGADLNLGRLCRRPSSAPSAALGLAAIQRQGGKLGGMPSAVQTCLRTRRQNFHLPPRHGPLSDQGSDRFE